MTMILDTLPWIVFGLLITALGISLVFDLIDLARRRIERRRLHQRRWPQEIEYRLLREREGEEAKPLLEELRGLIGAGRKK